MTTSKHKKKHQKLIKKRGRRRFRAQVLLWIAAFLAAFYLFTFREIPVLMYHFIGTEAEARENSLIVSAKTFDQQLSWLRQWGYRIYSLEEYEALRAHRSFSFEKGVVITFDDGNIGFLTNALPILEKYQAPAANFMVTDSMRKKTNGSVSVEDARKLAENPLITLGSHTVHHVGLMDQSELALRKEIAGSRRELSKMLGKDIAYFAYPGGFFDEEALEMVKSAGYRLAFTTSWKRLKGDQENAYSIVRVKVTEKDRNPANFWYKISGFYTLLKRLQNAF